MAFDLSRLRNTKPTEIETEDIAPTEDVGVTSVTDTETIGRWLKGLEQQANINIDEPEETTQTPPTFKVEATPQDQSNIDQDKLLKYAQEWRDAGRTREELDNMITIMMEWWAFDKTADTTPLKVEWLKSDQRKVWMWEIAGTLGKLYAGSIKKNVTEWIDTAKDDIWKLKEWDVEWTEWLIWNVFKRWIEGQERREEIKEDKVFDSKFWEIWFDALSILRTWAQILWDTTWSAIWTLVPWEFKETWKEAIIAWLNTEKGKALIETAKEWWAAWEEAKEKSPEFKKIAEVIEESAEVGLELAWAWTWKKLASEAIDTTWDVLRQTVKQWDTLIDTTKKVWKEWLDTLKKTWSDVIDKAKQVELPKVNLPEVDIAKLKENLPDLTKAKKSLSDIKKRVKEWDIEIKWIPWEELKISKLEKQAFPEDNIDALVKRIWQLPKWDKQKTEALKNTLSKIKTEWVEKYSELWDIISSKITSVSKTQDRILWTKWKYDIEDLVTTKWKRKTNYVKSALDDLEKIWLETDDIDILNKVDEFRSIKKINDKDLNDLARYYGSEFRSKSFSKTWEPKTSLWATKFENTRKWIKDISRGLQWDDTIKMLDSELADLYTSKALIDKVNWSVEDLTKKLKDRNVVQKVFDLAAKWVDVATFGWPRAFFTRILVPSNVWQKTMNSIDIQNALKWSLKKLDKINKKITPKTTDSELAKEFLNEFWKNEILNFANKVKGTARPKLENLKLKAKNKLADTADDIADKIWARSKLLWWESAKWIKVDPLDKAKALDRLWTDPDKIWKSTGWEKWTDWKWRFEIDDSKVKFYPENLKVQTWISVNWTEYSQRIWKLWDILEHNDLYKQYPNAKNINISISKRPEWRAQFNRWYKDEWWISFNKNNLTDELTQKDKSSLLHEVQHYIQEKEWFAKWWTITPRKDLIEKYELELKNLWDTEIWKIYKKRQKEFDDYWNNEYDKIDWDSLSMNNPKIKELEKKQYIAYNKFKENNSKFFNKRKELENKILDEKMKWFDWYQYLAWEVEARNVQTRLWKTKAEKKLLRPWKTEDIARSKQIIRKK